MKNVANKVAKPNAFLYYCVGYIAKIYYRLFYGHKIHNSVPKGLKPPYLVIAGHSCWFDYIITTVSMLPKRMNFVGAYNFFRDKTLKPVFDFMGVISKYQFTNDVGAVKKMKTVINRGGIVAIFPNGCLSNEGRPGGFAVFGIAKLIKFLNVPVIAIKTDGGYLTRPRWTKNARRGKLITSVSEIFTVNEIGRLSEDEIYNKVLSELSFDDYKWQREKMIPFKGQKLAEGVEYVLYKCPKCCSEFTLRSDSDRLYCVNCGNAVRMNRYLFFEPENENTVFFDGIDKWYDYERECLIKEIEKPKFELSAETELKCAEPGKYGYQHLGNGTVRMSVKEIIYEGTVNGKEEKRIFPMNDIPMVPYAANEYIEIAKGSDISRFIFSDLRQQIKWVMAVRLIRDRYFERKHGNEE